MSSFSLSLSLSLFFFFAAVLHSIQGFLAAQTVTNLPAMWETWVPSLGLEDPLEEGMLPTPVFLPGELPWSEGPGGLQSMGSQRVRYD